MTKGEDLLTEVGWLVGHLGGFFSGAAQKRLIEIGQAAVPALLRVMSHEYSAISVLGTIKDRRAVQPLIDLMKNGDEYAVARAAEALGDIGDPRAFPALLNTLSKEKELQNVAADAIGKMKLDDEQVKQLITLLELGNPWQKKGAVLALSRLGDARAAPALVRASLRGETSVTEVAKLALSEMGDEAVPVLLDFLMQDDCVGIILETAVNALGGIAKRIDTGEGLKEFEARLQQNYDRMRRKRRKGDLTEVQIQIARLRMAVAKRKNELAEDKGVLLDDKPKPPKRGMYQQMRRIRNG